MTLEHKNRNQPSTRPKITQILFAVTSSNNGVVWMDGLTVEPAGAGLAEALDYPGPWTVSGPHPWHAQPALAHEGQTAAAVGYPSVPSGQAAKIATRVQGPYVLSFQSSHQGSYNGLAEDLYGPGIKLELDGVTYAATLPTSSTSLVTKAALQASRVHIPAGEHTLAWSADRFGAREAALYLLDNVRTDPVPTAATCQALDCTLPRQSTGVHVPVTTAAATAVGGTLL